MKRTSTALAIAVAAQALGLWAGSPVRAQERSPEPRGSAGVFVFHDSMDTTIWSPFASAGLKLPSEWDFAVDWEADVISSASVDVVTAATDRVSELRNELGVSVSRENIAPDLDVNAGYAYSFEHDADSQILQAGAKRGFLDNNIELALSYGFSFNRVGLRDQRLAARDILAVHSIDVGGTWVPDTHTSLELTYTLGIADGYQANPYRRVPVTWRQDLRGAEWVEEAVPDMRWRHAWQARAQRAFGSRMMGTAAYRLYVDSWGILGHTLSTTASWELPRNFSLRARLRATFQGEADFYERLYEFVTRYRTRDRRLSRHLTGVAGVALTWETGQIGNIGVLRFRLAVDGLTWRYDDVVVPTLDPFGGADWESLGWVEGMVTQFGITLTP